MLWVNKIALSVKTNLKAWSGKEDSNTFVAPPDLDSGLAAEGYCSGS